MHRGNKTSKSTLVVRSIGIPGVFNPTLTNLRTEDVPSFLQVAEKNKIPLLFLRTIVSGVSDHPFVSALLRYEQRHQRTLDLVKFVSSILEEEKIRYTFFKTLKPFPYVPSDVDILLWSNDDLKSLEKRLNGEDCVSLERDAYGVTMFNSTYKLNIDLTTQIAVSGMVYMNKELIFDHVNEINFYGNMVQTLDPPAELLAVMAHSVFKEQIFTLSDYYTLVLSAQYWEEASKLAEKLHLKHALETVLKLTNSITVSAFGSLRPLSRKTKALEINYEPTFSDEEIELPKKYDLSSMIVELLKKFATDSNTTRSLSTAAKSFGDPAFYRKIIEHITREKY
jgi:hypothetical protein